MYGSVPLREDLAYERSKVRRDLLKEALGAHSLQEQLDLWVVVAARVNGCVRPTWEPPRLILWHVLILPKHPKVVQPVVAFRRGREVRTPAAVRKRRANVPLERLFLVLGRLCHNHMV